MHRRTPFWITIAGVGTLGACAAPGTTAGAGPRFNHTEAARRNSPSAAAQPESNAAQPERPAGYTMGSGRIARAPITLSELEEIKASLLMGDDDLEALRMSRAVLEPHVGELVGVWYGFVGANPHLLASFSNDRGEPDGEYLARVRARFERWVLDTASAEYDQGWLDYQFEIGRRHHRVGKNLTDGASASEIVPFRHLAALTVPVTTTLRPFLERGGHTPEEVDRMQAAWVKSVLLQATLWSYPYVREGDF